MIATNKLICHQNSAETQFVTTMECKRRSINCASLQFHVLGIFQCCRFFRCRPIRQLMSTEDVTRQKCHALPHPVRREGVGSRGYQYFRRPSRLHNTSVGHSSGQQSGGCREPRNSSGKVTIVGDKSTKYVVDVQHHLVNFWWS